MTNSIMIIGAGPGIGQAVAEKFSREGWHVVLTARNADRLADLSAALSGKVSRSPLCKPMRPTRPHCARRSPRVTASPAA